MIREMTLGQYYKTDSVLHQMDPRVKLMGTMLYVITLFFPKSIFCVILATIFLSWIIRLSKVPVSMYIRGIRPLLVIIFFSAAVNLLFTPGKILLKAGPAAVTKEGLFLAMYLIIRLVYLIIGSSVMTFTTTPNQLTDGIEKGLRFLKMFHVPVHEFAMMMSIALRFIPLLTEELDKIMKAQMSRGVDFDSGNLIEKARKLIPVLIPLFVAAIRRASDLAMAMDARCYHGGEGRTRLHPLSYKKIDFAAYTILIAYVASMLFVSFVL